MAFGEDISISPESLDEKGESVLQEFKKIEEAIRDIEESKAKLSSWKSVNKDRYEAKLNEALPKMREMSEAVSSYGSVAKISSRRIIEAERKISRALDA